MTRRALTFGAGAAMGTAATASRAQTAAPLRFGLLLDMSSVFSDLSGKGSETAVRMAVEDFGGNVLARPIELLVADHQTKADIAGAQARKWFDTDGVQAILEVVTTGPTVAAIEVAQRSGKIVITNGAGSASISNENCTPNTIQYSWTTRALARTVGRALTKSGKSTWFFLTVDYTFGQQLEADTTAVVQEAGGTVLGSVRVPLGTTDFSSYLLRAQASGATTIGFALAGTDLVNALKQAHEFGLADGKRDLAALILLINDVHSLGLDIAQGTLLAEPFYWDLNDGTRAFARRFFARMQRMPNFVQAGAYSSTLAYLKAVQAAGTLESGPVLDRMRSAPIHDMFTESGQLRRSGLMAHEMHLFRVKAPGASRMPWDYYDRVATISSEEAFGPGADSSCRL